MSHMSLFLKTISVIFIIAISLQGCFYNVEIIPNDISNSTPEKQEPAWQEPVPQQPVPQESVPQEPVPQQPVPQEVYTDKNAKEKLIEKTYESSYQVDFVNKIKTVANIEINRMEHKIPGHLGLIIYDMNDKTPIIAHNANKCFIPASLTKIVLCSALFDILNETNLDPEIAFQNYKQTLQFDNPEFDDMTSVLHSLNNYTISSAPNANRTAEQLWNFIREIHKEQTGDIPNLDDFMLHHLDKISFVEPCNKIENASGLTTKNRLMPYQIADCMFHLKDYPVYLNSLMQPGQAMLTDRLLDIDKTNRFKTGSLQKSGVLCLAGYLSTPVPLCIVIIINDLPEKNFSDGYAWIDNIIKVITSESKEL